MPSGPLARPVRLALASAAALVLLLAACGDSDDDDASSDTTTETTAAPDDDSGAVGDDYGSPGGDDDETTTGDDAATGAEVATADSDLGTILVDGQGLTLYLFTNDTQGEPSTCTGDCGASWPALTGPATAGDGADDALLGTVTNADGTEQVTYDGWPLYYFAADSGPGDTTGQGVGGIWFVVSPEGSAVES